jgi:hypothetical protein
MLNAAHASLDRVADWFINRHPEPRVLLGGLICARAHLT